MLRMKILGVLLLLSPSLTYSQHYAISSLSNQLKLGITNSNNLTDSR